MGLLWLGKKHFIVLQIWRLDEMILSLGKWWTKMKLKFGTAGFHSVIEIWLSWRDPRKYIVLYLYHVLRCNANPHKPILLRVDLGLKTVSLSISKTCLPYQHLWDWNFMKLISNGFCSWFLTWKTILLLYKANDLMDHPISELLLLLFQRHFVCLSYPDISLDEADR